MHEKIIIGDCNHTWFYFSQFDNTVFLTPEWDRAQRFNSVEDACQTISFINHFDKYLHEYKDQELNKPTEFRIWNVNPTVLFNDITPIEKPISVVKFPIIHFESKEDEELFTNTIEEIGFTTTYQTPIININDIKKVIK